GANRRPALLADLRTPQSETDHDVVTLDFEVPNLPHPNARDLYVVTWVDATRIFELRVIGRRREKHWDACQTLSHPDHEQQDDDTHQPVADPVRTLQRPHCGVHLPVGCVVTRTVRTGPPGCKPFSFNVMSHA